MIKAGIMDRMANSNPLIRHDARHQLTPIRTAIELSFAERNAWA